ncbi:MAG: HAMP domain-containing sensor histidine kinase [Opitutaceae bacterium]
MVFVSIATPAAVLYRIGVATATDEATAGRLQSAAWLLLPLVIGLSLLLARFAVQVRKRSLAMLAQMHAVEEKLRAQRETAEKASQAKTELLAVASHDLKNPLSAIVGMSSILLDLKRTAPDQEAVKDDIDILESINASATHMFAIVRGILANEGLQLGWADLKFGPVELPAVCQETVQFNTPLARQRNVTLATELTDTISLTGDATLLREALDNYLSNAIKYSPAGGTVTVTLQLVENGRQAEIAVRDEGPGIPPAEQGKLFTKFKKLGVRPTEDEFSTGLGLSIVKTIVERHHGTVGCDSEPGHGCRFWLRLPLSLTPAQN